MKYKVYSNNYESTLKDVKELKERLNEINWVEDDNAENIIVLGGDGSVLRAFRSESHRIEKLKIYAIHSGGLGFYTDFNGYNVEEIINDFKNETPREELIETIKVTVGNRDYYGLNEFTLMSPLKPTIYTVHVDDLKLQTFRSTGIAVASTMGSTGFAKSLGGAVIDTDICAMEIIEVAACSNNAYRSIGAPVVVSSNKVVKINGDICENFFTLDAIELDTKDCNEVSITKGPKVKFMRYSKMKHLERVSKSFVLEGRNNV